MRSASLKDKHLFRSRGGGIVLFAASAAMLVFSGFSCADSPRYTRASIHASTTAPKKRKQNAVRDNAASSIRRSSAKKDLVNSYYQRGKASFYGRKFHGRKTANGERYNQNKLTAAHRTLPFGTIVRVTNFTNGKSVVVRINDRGPWSGKNRVIDLSRAAAEAIDMVSQGIVSVGIELVE